MEDGTQTVKSKVKKVYAFNNRFIPTQQTHDVEHHEVYETRMETATRAF